MILTPRDWQQIAQGEALTLAGMPEAHAKLVEAKRYGLLADEIDRQRAENSEYRELLRELLVQLCENPGVRDDGNAPGHCHQIPGVWDNDNDELSGKPCVWCAVVCMCIFCAWRVCCASCCFVSLQRAMWESRFKCSSSKHAVSHAGIRKHT